MAGTETLAELKWRAADAALPGACGTGVALPGAPVGPLETDWLASPRGQAADGRPRAGRRGRALARWAALLGLLALAAGQAAAPWPLAAAARQDLPPQPAALTDGAPAERAAPAPRDMGPQAPAGFGWG
jgi:hypothetical protein